MTLYPVKNFVLITAEANGQSVSDINKRAEGQKALMELSQYNIEKAQNNLKTASDKRSSSSVPTKAEIEIVLKQLSKGETSYRKVLKNVYIVGDSLMNGLEAYNILNSNHLITQVSASLYHLSGNVNRIIKLKPPVLILHYGVNMISTSKKQLNNFTGMYTRLVKQIQKGSPDTRIIISGLFPVDRDVARAKRFSKIDAYNEALQKMCKNLDVEFMDSSSVLKEHPECYGGDGIHLSKAFYEKYWLRFVIKEMEILG